MSQRRNALNKTLPPEVLASESCDETNAVLSSMAAERMQIFVKSLDRTFVVNVHEEADVTDLKAAIEDVEFIPAECMRLTTGK